MTDQHPITPPPELVEEWANAAAHEFDIAKFAARWGADQELEACVKWIAYHPPVPDDLRTARRPKAPSLKDKLKEAIYSENLDEALCLVEQLDDSL